MMKSFFKKLAFVMALAMVVSAMAPAGSAFADEVKPLGIVAQKDDTWTVLETDKAEVGAEGLDYRYKGAPSNYKELDPTWASSDETVATVDKNGLVTTLKNGETVISITLSNGQKGELKLTVADKEVEKAFEIKQTAGDTVKLTFADAAAATDKVELYKIFKTSNGNVEAAWPCVATVKDGVTTVKAYVPFADGEEFIVKANDVAEGFVAYVGQITGIKVVPVTANNGNTYADANGAYPIEFKVTYLAGDIEFTADPNNGWMTYEALDPNENIYIDATSGLSTYIYAVGAATRVKATYTYYDTNYNPVELTYEFPLVGYAAPVEVVDSVDAYTITNQTAHDKVTWNKNEIVVGDTGYFVGLNIGTSIDKNYWFNAQVKDKTDFAAEGALGTITFKSSDETKLLVGTNDGSLDAISDGSAVVIVQLTTYDDNGNATTKNIYAFNVVIKAARKATSIKLGAPSVSVLTDDNTGDASLTKAEVTYEVLDQYGATYTGADVPEVKTSATVSATTLTATPGDPGKGKITVWGYTYAADKVNSVVYTVKANNVQTTLTVVPKRPATAEGDVVTTGYAVNVGDIDANVEKKDAGVLYANVKLFTTWSGINTGYVTDAHLFSYNDFFTKNTNGDIAKGDLVLKVTGPDGLVTAGLDSSAFEWTTTGLKIKAAEVASGAALKTLKAGTYTVELYTVTNVTQSTTATTQSLIANRRVASDTFKVSNTAAQVSVKEYGNQLASNAATIKDAIVEIVTFQGVDGFTVTAADIVSVDGVWNENAGKYFVKSIKVNVPIKDTNCTFEQTVTIGKTFNVPNVTSK